MPAMHSLQSLLTLQSLRQSRRIARCVLLWFGLSLGVAIAAPLVHPQGMQLVCTAAGSLKVADGNQSLQAPTLDCPLCATLGALPPLEAPLFTSAAPQPQALLQATGLLATQASAAPPPARGPPAA